MGRLRATMTHHKFSRTNLVPGGKKDERLRMMKEKQMLAAPSEERGRGKNAVWAGLWGSFSVDHLRGKGNKKKGNPLLSNPSRNSGH